MNATIPNDRPQTSAPGGSLDRLVGNQTTDKTVRDLPVKVRLKVGQIIVEQKVCGELFSFPAAVWPQGALDQFLWVTRLTPWWDIGTRDWTPKAQRLREACQRAINTILQGGGVSRKPRTSGNGWNERHAPPPASQRQGEQRR